MSHSSTTPKNGHLAAIRERVRLRRASEHHATRLQLARDYTLIFLEPVMNFGKAGICWADDTEGISQ